jgi:hypothetical protein
MHLQSRQLTAVVALLNVIWTLAILLIQVSQAVTSNVYVGGYGCGARGKSLLNHWASQPVHNHGLRKPTGAIGLQVVVLCTTHAATQIVSKLCTLSQTQDTPARLECAMGHAKSPASIPLSLPVLDRLPA